MAAGTSPTSSGTQLVSCSAAGRSVTRVPRVRRSPCAGSPLGWPRRRSRRRGSSTPSILPGTRRRCTRPRGATTATGSWRWPRWTSEAPMRPTPSATPPGRRQRRAWRRSSACCTRSCRS